jgi:hypothetical protein
MKTRFAVAAAAAVGLLAGAPARAVDPWEGGQFADDTSQTRNTLSPGLAQQHDLDEAGTSTNDVDWMVAPMLEGHSYEARISGSNANFDWGDCPTCAQFERIDGLGNVVTEDVGVVQEGHGPGTFASANDRSVRWMNDAGDSTLNLVRVSGNAALPENFTWVYTIRYWDTTYTVPRWNTANGQATVLVITNTAQYAQQARIRFYDESGTLLAVQPATLDQNKPYVLNVGSLSALAGRSGFALVAHTAGHGGLTGKAVSLEPATGFTFDTPIQAIPQ